MSIVEHALDWSKLAELLPQLVREYRLLATRHRALLTALAMLPPLLIPLEAAKWFMDSTAALVGFACLYAAVAAVLFHFTGRWVENVRRFGVQRIAEDKLISRTLERIERDSGMSGEMSFEELYISDGSGIERRTRKHIIYAENDIEINMDRGQKLFANGNIPLQINMTLVVLFCLYMIIGAFFLANDGRLQTILMMVQQAVLFLAPLGIYYIQNIYRQYLLNHVIAEQLLEYVTDDDAREAMDALAETAAAQARQRAQDAAQGQQQSDDSGEEGVQLQA